MTSRIISVPMPPIFILESEVWRDPRGIMRLNMRSTRDLRTGMRWSLRSRLRPQKVKNNVTSLPMEAAPLAIMKAAIILSKSLEKMTMVFPVPVVRRHRALIVGRAFLHDRGKDAAIMAERKESITGACAPGRDVGGKPLVGRPYLDGIPVARFIDCRFQPCNGAGALEPAGIDCVVTAYAFLPPALEHDASETCLT